MITIQDLYNIVGNKISNEISKSIIRNNFPPNIADQICNAIDAHESADHFQRLMQEWIELQQKQQQVVQYFLSQYYNK
jgi:hypothetical protein